MARVLRLPGAERSTRSFSPGKSGLTKVSYALIDHLRSIDKRRIRRIFGRVENSDLEALDEGLALFLGLSDVL